MIPNVASILVLFNPDVPRLRALLTSLKGQVGRVYAVDNSEGRAAEHRSLFEQCEMKVEYVPLGTNFGIATAQNIGIRQALEAGASDVLLLDQDSLLPPGMVNALVIARERLESSGVRVAAISPSFVDEKTGEAGPAIRHALLRVKKIKVYRHSPQPIWSDYVISSGALINAQVLETVGLMREELFIDWVDIEWGLRAKQKGYKCYIVPGVTMQHSIGDESVAVLGRSINLHQDLRHYYIVRNATYLLRARSMGFAWRTVTLGKIPLYVLFYSWHSRKRIKSLLLLSRGFLDGLRGRMGRFRA